MQYFLNAIIMRRLHIIVSTFVFITISSVEGSFRIIGGNETTIEKHPWQVSLQFLGVHFCAGSIISTNQVITAAHCINQMIATSYQIVCGATNLTQEVNVYRVEDYIIHDEFDSDTYDYDIAVIQLTESLTFSRNVLPIDLPEENYTVPDGTEVLASGWGVTDPDSSDTSTVLREIDLSTVNWNECKSKLSSYGEVTDRMICAGYDRGGKDTCQADSGGALELGTTLIGIISWGASCGKAGIPGVYTDVAYLREWIRTHTGV